MHEAGHGLTYLGIGTVARRARRSTGTRRSGSASLRAARGRTSSAARSPSGAAGCPELQRLFPQLESVDLDDFLPRHQPRRPRPDPRRLRRGHVLAPHHPPLRAGAGARRRHARARRPARGVEREDARPAGVDVPDDARGVLQDVHWTRASYGYFPTYALGNVLSVQIWRAVEEELPDLDDAARGGRVRHRSTSRCGRGSTGTAASSRRWRRSSARSARTRSTRSRISRTCAARSPGSSPPSPSARHVLLRPVRASDRPSDVSARDSAHSPQGSEPPPALRPGPQASRPRGRSGFVGERTTRSPMSRARHGDEHGSLPVDSSAGRSAASPPRRPRLLDARPSLKSARSAPPRALGRACP